MGRNELVGAHASRAPAGPQVPRHDVRPGRTPDGGLRRSRRGLTFDSLSRHFVVTAGERGGEIATDEWLLTVNPAAQVLAHGNACAGASGTADIVGFGAPTVGSADFALDVFAPTPAALRPVFVMITSAPGSVSIGNCTLAVDPTTHFHTALFWQIATGFSSLPVPIPANVRLLGCVP